MTNIIPSRLFISSTCTDIGDCRTLSSIILSCLATLVACTWASVHPNVPKPLIGRRKLVFHRWRLMMLAVIAPEVIVVWALRQRMVASKLSEDFAGLGMTMTHGFFVSMGGFTMAQGPYLRPIPPHIIGPGKPVNPNSIMSIRDYQIHDRSKGDEITKGLALLQTGWFMAQCIARRVESLPLTELELVTIAFSSLNFVIYAVWWDKPLDVRYPICLGPPPAVDPPMKKIREPFAPSWSLAVVYGFNYAINIVLEMFVGERDDDDIAVDASRVPTLWAGRLTKNQRGWAASIGIFLAMGFGAIHCVAWNYTFPSEAEQILWRSGSVTVVVVPFLLFVAAVDVMNRSVPVWYHNFVFGVVIPLGATVYVIGRIILMVLPFTALRSLPQDVYKDIEWTHFVPHIS
ncbi:hypothetical protein BDZ94DRAFT_1258701 [Collybia nuda]|uniref:Uncharacterized protein n=1 Tax=Collybia nuda TaxID=64659 RepID=A0A9P6CIT0_9AGAR|nr:hypothetical protein BDZ94DRAFT_1258701 [Collybia nuda]